MKNINVLKTALLRQPEKKNLKDLAKELDMSYNTMKSRIRSETDITVKEAMFLHEKYGIICDIKKGVLILKLEA